MSIVQFARMIWARRLIILAAAVFTFLGAFVVTLIAQPRYEGKARVMLNLLRPDPVTGESVNPRAVNTYVATQVEIMKDYAVTGRVVDQLNWLSDPGQIQRYDARPASDSRDFRRWLAQRVADRTSAKLVAGSVLEVTFSSGSPVEAGAGAEAVRQAYLDSSLQDRRGDAAKMANWYNTQAEAARKAAEVAETTKAAFERENGIVMQADQTDLDSDRLRALATQVAIAPAMAPMAPASSAASLQLAQLDAQIAQTARNLGPNHPEMQELRARRVALARIASEETAAIRAASNAAAASVGAVDRALQAQKSRVIGQRDKVERLRQLQAEVDLRREQYRKTAARAAELNLEAAVADTGMRPLGVVLTPNSPAFPNKPLILGGSAGLGIALGLFLALFVELLSRRVRGVEDLENGLDIPCLAVIDSIHGKRRWKLQLPALFRTPRRRTVQAT